jgi:hypothetical protein
VEIDVVLKCAALDAKHGGAAVTASITDATAAGMQVHTTVGFAGMLILSMCCTWALRLQPSLGHPGHALVSLWGVQLQQRILLTTV